MKHQRQNLDIAFRAIQPERVLDGLLRPRAKGGSYELNSRTIGWEEYQHYTADRLKNYSLDELENLYQLLCQDMRGPAKNRASVFNLLFGYSREVLKLERGVPVCRFEELLDWRDISHRLGQDIFTTAYLAWQDWEMGNDPGFFSWPAIIGTDNSRLYEMLGQGISENHFHLNGSSQSFSLSWACLMNHPKKIYLFFEKDKIRKDMERNLSASVLGRTSDYQLPWKDRLLSAAWLRARLYRSFFLDGRIRDKEISAFFSGHNKLKDVEDLVQPLRFCYGRRVRQPDGSMRCLDYMFPDSDEGYDRLLAGERHFLYQGFSRYLRGELSEAEADLFYLYLLLKSRFRGEIIQVNGRVGFRNFSMYQDRKEHFWETIPEYKAEGRRLAVGATLHDSRRMLSLETRIVPKTQPDQQYSAVFQTDRLVHFAERGQAPGDRIRRWGENALYFYVLHFIKDRDSQLKTNWHAKGRMRNQKVRTDSKRMAIALAAALRHSSYLRKRIRGIDAASFEIGCRPETFATEFRFLKSLPAAMPRHFTSSGCDTFSQLRATCHVGEDFLDIANGLRAIDEAVQFLKLERGDRLGHALALGVEPERHYQEKEHQILLPKQDRLDDLVWLLFRSVELGIDMDVGLREKFRMDAEELLQDLYGQFFPNAIKTISLQDYYGSWKLRGDHPECYRTPNETAGTERLVLPGSYRSFMRRKDPMLDLWRERKEMRYLYYLYHFEPEIRRRGESVIAVKVDKPYMDLMRVLQRRMQKYIGDRGIMIECNLTSNYLIGTFRRYDEHPIFRFNGFGFVEEGAEGQLSVSVNTDDQGIFDTSLENEYALLACAMSKAVTFDGRKRYSRDVIYKYLDHIRQMGNEQSF